MAQERIIATDETIREIVKSEIDRLGNLADLNHIDLSRVTTMHNVFTHTKFNGDISEWDVSNVKSMSGMFAFSEFNGDISKWDVSKVEDMKRMFAGSQFNGDISSWNVSNVKDMEQMFVGSQFNGDISRWDVSNVENIAIQNPPKEPLRISSWDRKTYIAALNRFATLTGGIRALTYVPTIFTLMASANSNQHSLWTWFSWILASGTMSLLLYERNDRKVDSVILIQLTNTFMCVVTTAVVLWYRF